MVCCEGLEDVCGELGGRAVECATDLEGWLSRLGIPRRGYEEGYSIDDWRILCAFGHPVVSFLHIMLEWRKLASWSPDLSRQVTGNDYF